MISAFYRQVTLLLFINIFCGSICTAQEILAKYIQQGVESNLNIQKLKSDYQTALWALKESKRMFGPTVDFAGNYNRNLRSPIDIPQNGVPEKFIDFLNQLQTTSSDHGKLYFPPRNQFSGAVQVSQSLFNRTLDYQAAIKNSERKASENLLEDYKTELKAEITLAYFRYLQACQQKEILTESVVLTRDKMISIGQLIDQHKLTRDALYKGRTDQDRLAARIAQTENERLKSKNYFNFLLNKDQADSVLIDQDCLFNAKSRYTVENLPVEDSAAGYRLNYLSNREKSVGLQQKLIKAQLLPVLQFNGRAGISGTQFSLDNPRLPFSTLQLSMKWNLFSSGVNHAKFQQAQFTQQSIHAQYEQTKSQLKLQELAAISDVNTQLGSYTAVSSARLNSEKYFQAVNERFQLGMASTLELFDAKSQLLEADLERLQWYYNLQTAISTYQKNTGKTIKLIQ